jgi:cysteine desulfurase family protein (TIGR01976 family)
MINPDHSIRRHFPALSRLHGGNPVAYFDGPGGTQVPLTVTEVMADYLLHHNANTHWAYPTSEETDHLLLEARRVLAEFLNGRPEEVVFGQNMTTLTFHLARGLGRRWGPGDEIVVTDLDHHANRAPWEALVAERGVTVRAVPFDPDTGVLAWDALLHAITPRTRLLAIGAASNALGTVTDVRAACAHARAAGALTFVDAVHSAPHLLPDVAELDCDFLACSPYKFYGPHLGVLWGRESLLAEVDVPRLAPAPQTAPERLETGTLSHEGIVGSAEAVRFLAALAPGRATLREALVEAYRVLHERGAVLFGRMWEGLARIPGLRLYGPRPGSPRTPTLAFTLRGIPSETVARRLAVQGLFVSHGDFYAATVVERLGLSAEGLVRAGCACYTTAEEVDRLVEAVSGMITNDHPSRASPASNPPSTPAVPGGGRSWSPPA